MNFVEPIRDSKKIAQIKNLLRGERRYRDLLLFVVGIDTALRISDLLRLQIVYFLDEQKQIKKKLLARRAETGQAA
jgi:integrase